jgi:hypothetical protein
MNEVLATRWSESVRRLALGIEPTDPLIRSRIARRIDVALDGTPSPVPRRLRDPGASPWEEPTLLARVDRHRSCRHVVLAGPGVEDPIALRLDDPTQRYVPRRLSIRLPDPLGAGRRIRPTLYPGAAYGLAAGALGLRGRIVRDGEPMRWARAEARRTADDVVVGHAHGDQHGEFLLVLDQAASRGADLILPLEVQVTVFGPDDAPLPEDFPDADTDPLWDLPVEEVDLTVDAEGVLAGTTRPDGFTSRPGSIRAVTLSWHGLVREEFDFS